MSAGLGPKARKALSKFGTIEWGLYALVYSFLLNFCWGFFDLAGISGALFRTLVILLNLPALVLITGHIYRISRSLGIGAMITNDKTLRGSALYLLGGGVLGLASVVLLTVVFLYLDWEHYGGLLEYAPYIYFGIIPAYVLMSKKAIALVWLWVVEYTHQHPKEAGAFDLVKEHPKSKLIKLTFNAVFGEGKKRTQAATQLAFLATYVVSPEGDEADEETMDLANKVAPETVGAEKQLKLMAIEANPEKFPLRARNIKDGKCPNCGAPVPSQTTRYCTK